MSEDPWHKIPSAAQYAGVKPRTFRKWIHGGLLRVNRVNGTILVSESAIDDFLRGHQVQGPTLTKAERIASEMVKGL